MGRLRHRLGADSDQPDGAGAAARLIDPLEIQHGRSRNVAEDQEPGEPAREADRGLGQEEPVSESPASRKQTFASERVHFR
jgi:hypothetical protein